jgi:hypothetical protein
MFPLPLFDLHIDYITPENIRSVNNICLHCGHFSKVILFEYSYAANSDIDVLKKSADMMLTNEIVHYMQQWNYIKIRQTKTKY